ncbi:HAD family hydrolase [Guggenheimella bovis]
MKSIIYDLDGTLWDASKPISFAWSQVLSRYGLRTVSDADVRSVCGLPMDRILDQFGLGSHNHLLPELCQREEEHLLEEFGTPYEGVRETLEVLQKKKVPVCIVSNCQDGYIQTFLKTLKLEDYFLDFESFGATGLSKGENIKKVIFRNDLKEPIYIGDTRGDEIAAREAGIPFYQAAWGFGSPISPDVILKNFSDILNYL